MGAMAFRGIGKSRNERVILYISINGESGNTDISHGRHFLYNFENEKRKNREIGIALFPIRR